MQKLETQLGRSNYLMILHATKVLGSLAIIGYLPMGLLVKCLLCSWVMGYSAWVLIRNQQWQAIAHDQVGWSIQYRDQFVPIQIDGSTTITHWVTILRFMLPQQKRKRSCVIFRDAVSADLYRQLMVRLRLKAGLKKLSRDRPGASP